MVLNKDIADNDYNIAVSSFVEGENTTEEVDIEKLNAHIAEIVIKQNKLRTATRQKIFCLQKSPPVMKSRRVSFLKHSSAI